MFASFHTISFTFEAVRGEYLSRTQRATQRPAILSMLQMEIYGKPYVQRIYICGLPRENPHSLGFTKKIIFAVFA